MAITSAIVLFFVTWFLVLFVVLPIGLRTQGDEGEVVPGTHPGSPANFQFKRTMIIVTVITVVVWSALVAVILSGVVPIRDLR